MNEQSMYVPDMYCSVLIQQFNMIEYRHGNQKSFCIYSREFAKIIIKLKLCATKSKSTKSILI